MRGQQYHSIPKAFELETGQRVHESTACRYALRGIGPPGNKVILKTWMIGNRRRTTIEAVRKFIEERTAATTPHAEVSE